MTDFDIRRNGRHTVPWYSSHWVRIFTIVAVALVFLWNAWMFSILTPPILYPTTGNMSSPLIVVENGHQRLKHNRQVQYTDGPQELIPNRQTPEPAPVDEDNNNDDTEGESTTDNEDSDDDDDEFNLEALDKNGDRIFENNKSWYLNPLIYRKSNGCDFANIIEQFQPSQLEINCRNVDKIQLGEQIGESYWHKIYRSEWGGKTTVVKVLKDERKSRSDALPRLVKEAAILFSMREVPNIVQLIGWCNSMMIVEYVPDELGALLFESDTEISVTVALEIALDVTSALAELHEAQGGVFAHTRIQPRHFFINESGKIVLHNVFRMKYAGTPQKYSNNHDMKCTFVNKHPNGKWHAPEEYSNKPLDEKVDIYSLSLILWSLRSRIRPYDEVNAEQVNSLVSQGIRPQVELMSDYPKKMQELIISAWSSDPSERPKASVMRDEIKKILHEQKNPEILLRTDDEDVNHADLVRDDVNDLEGVQTEGDDEGEGMLSVEEETAKTNNIKVSNVQVKFEEQPSKYVIEANKFLKPSLYKKDSGCDFSAIVADFQPNDLEINCKNIHELKLETLIGQGYWREVYQAHWKGQPVAVKVVKKQLLDRPDIVTRHVEEAATMYAMRNDSNIVQLVGWCDSTVIVDWIPGKLEKLIFDSQKEISVLRALELAYDAAMGVAQLHSHGLTHSDIQTRQFLIDAHGKVLLNDFNRIKYTGPRLAHASDKYKVDVGLPCTFSTSIAKGKWRAPEEYEMKYLDKKLDIYSLSLVLWGFRSRVKPYGEVARSEVREIIAEAGVRPSVEEMNDYPQEMQDLIERAWSYSPEERPTADELVQEIGNILSIYRQTSKDRT